MKKLIFSILFLVISIHSYSQHLKIGFESGYGSYKMLDLKDLNTLIKKSFPFTTEMVSDFPSHIYYKPSVIIKFNRFGVGMNYEFLSTGSRISGKDYSGEFRTDFLVKSNVYGFSGEFYSKFQKGYQIICYLNVGKSFSTLNASQFFKVQDSVFYDSKSIYKAHNYLIEPGLRLEYSYKSFSIGLNGGYAFQFGGESFGLQGNKDIKLGNSARPDWSGIRLGISLYYKI